MNVIIVNCFDTYQDRITTVKDFFNNKNSNVTIVQSNFRHFKKEKIKEEKKDYIYINTLPYYKNLSIKRLYSHYKFSKQAYQEVNKQKPDLIYIVIPPNSLVKRFYKYKLKQPNVKIIYDIIDLWPETMPIGKIEKIFALPINIWRNLRNKYIKNANYIITECDLFKEKLEKNLTLPMKSIYWSRDFVEEIGNTTINEELFEICYLGSINNIIDINFICEILKEIKKHVKVKIHIIGDGEKKDEFINKLINNDIELEYHGKVYDENIKKGIFNRCRFGLNIMKENVCVGLTMKSLDYFRYGLPIINNIPADTEKIIRDYNIGYNLNYENIEEQINKIINITTEDLINMRENTKKVFEKYFSTEVFYKKMNELIGEEYEE